jgi:hypothetical protein
MVEGDLNFEVPMTKLPDGRHAISAETCLNHPEVHAFVLRMSNFYVYDPSHNSWLSPLPEESA